MNGVALGAIDRELLNRIAQHKKAEGVSNATGRCCRTRVLQQRRSEGLAAAYDDAAVHEAGNGHNRSLDKDAKRNFE